MSLGKIHIWEVLVWEIVTWKVAFWENVVGKNLILNYNISDFLNVGFTQKEGDFNEDLKSFKYDFLKFEFGDE